MVMQEPEYTYVRGKGWVIAPQHTLTLRCGTLCKLVFRQPSPGDAWDVTDAKSTRASDIDNWISFLTYYSLNELKCDSLIGQYGKEYVTVVLEPL